MLPSVRTMKLSPKRGGGNQERTARDLHRGQGQVVPAWERSGWGAGGGVPSARQVSAGAEPSSEILIWSRNRTGFSTGSAQGPGAGRAKGSGGQWQEGWATWPGDRSPLDNSLHRLCWGLPGLCLCVHFAHDRFTFYTDRGPPWPPPPQALYSAPHLSQVWPAQPGETPGWTLLLPARLSLAPPPLTLGGS